jgi:hypothetical protein
MYRNGLDEDDSQSFITRDRLEGVWLATQGQDACLLDEFRKYVPTTSRADVKDHVLSILSILILIKWDNWLYFTKSFGLEDSQLKDSDLPLSLEQCRAALDSSAIDVQRFRQQQYAFIPIAIEQKPTPPFLEPEWRLPLKYQGEKNEEGAYGTVYKVKIAKGYLRSKEGKPNDAVSSEKSLFNVLS